MPQSISQVKLRLSGVRPLSLLSPRVISNDSLFSQPRLLLRRAEGEEKLLEHRRDASRSVLILLFVHRRRRGSRPSPSPMPILWRSDECQRRFVPSQQHATGRNASSLSFPTGVVRGEGGRERPSSPGESEQRSLEFTLNAWRTSVGRCFHRTSFDLSEKKKSMFCFTPEGRTATRTPFLRLAQSSRSMLARRSLHTDPTSSRIIRPDFATPMKKKFARATLVVDEGMNNSAINDGSFCDDGVKRR